MESFFLLAVFFFLPLSSVLYFIPSLILFIISSVAAKKGKTGGLAAHRKGLKINFIVSAVIFGVTMAVFSTFFIILYIGLSHM
jgi:hypothetical protein